MSSLSRSGSQPIKNREHIYIGSDHGGFSLKENLLRWLPEQFPALSFEDCGAFELEPEDDYPTWGFKVAQSVAQKARTPLEEPTHLGILLCRSGAGMSVAANRFCDVRAVVCPTVEHARLARAHNNANILILEGDFVTEVQAQHIIEVFLQTSYEGGRHDRRVEALSTWGTRLSSASTNTIQENV